MDAKTTTKSSGPNLGDTQNSPSVKVHVKQTLQDGAPGPYYFRVFIPSYTRLQPWFFIGFAGGCNYLITRVPAPFL